MLRSTKQMGRWIAIAVAIGLFCSWEAQAKKPPKPPGDDSSAGYTIVPFLTPVPPPNFESVRSSVGDLNDVGHAVGSEPKMQFLTVHRTADRCELMPNRLHRRFAVFRLVQLNLQAG